MKINTAIKLSMILNIVTTASFIFIQKNLFFLFLILLNTLLLFRKPWIRQILIFLFFIGLILNLGGLIYQIYITEDFNIIVWILSVLILGIIYFIYSLLIFTSQPAKSYYKTEAPRDPYDPEGWICPKCSSKMVFATKCWNCEFQRGEDAKPINLKSLKPSMTEENDKIDSYLKKKGDEIKS